MEVQSGAFIYYRNGVEKHYLLMPKEIKYILDNDIGKDLSWHFERQTNYDMTEVRNIILNVIYK